MDELSPEEFDRIVGDSDELPKSLQERLDEYNKNFDSLNGVLGESSLLEASAKRELRVEETKDVLGLALPVAVQTLIGLCGFAVSETVKLKAAMYIVDINLGKNPGLKTEDPAKELIERLREPVRDEGEV
jgi:sugar phosphate isomerase/epimerase